jgi:hypothetical protein
MYRTEAARPQQPSQRARPCGQSFAVIADKAALLCAAIQQFSNPACFDAA